MNARRPILQAEIQDNQSTNAGLWLNKFLKSSSKEDKESRSGLIGEVSKIQPSTVYRSFYNRWEQSLKEMQAKTRKAEVKGRMVIGMGDESVLETSVTLHHTYGVPYIPGSALKGVAASYTRKRLDNPSWQKDGDAYRTLFGDTSNAGYITFFDALYIPDSGYQKQALYPDVLTVHHQEYYQNTPNAPADWDSPNPVPFLSATGSYLIALAGPPQWVDITFDILTFALVEFGVGGKTSSGYGKMIIDPPPVDPMKEKTAQIEQKELELITALDKLPIKKVANELNQYIERWRKLEGSTEIKQRVARKILDKVESAGRTKDSQGKAWYQELLACLQQ